MRLLECRISCPRTPLGGASSQYPHPETFSYASVWDAESRKSEQLEPETYLPPKKEGNDGAAAGLAGSESLSRLQLSCHLCSLSVSEFDCTASQRLILCNC